MHDFYSFHSLLLSPVDPLGYLWFLYVLMLLFLIVPVLDARIKNKSGLLVGSLLLALMVGSGFRFPWSIFNTTIGEGFYFILGSYIFHKKGTWADCKNKKWALLAVVICLLNCGAYLFFRDMMPHNIVQKIAVALSACYLLFIAFKNYAFLGDNLFLQACGRNCLQLYILHIYFVGSCRNMVRYLHINALGLDILISFLVGILGPLAVAYFFKRTRYLNFVFEPVKTLKQWGSLKN